MLKLTKIDGNPTWIEASSIMSIDRGKAFAECEHGIGPLIGDFTILGTVVGQRAVRETVEEVLEMKRIARIKEEARYERFVKRMNRNDWEEESGDDL